MKNLLKYVIIFWLGLNSNIKRFGPDKKYWEFSMFDPEDPLIDISNCPDNKK